MPGQQTRCCPNILAVAAARRDRRPVSGSCEAACSQLQTSHNPIEDSQRCISDRTSSHQTSSTSTWSDVRSSCRPIVACTRPIFRAPSLAANPKLSSLHSENVRMQNPSTESSLRKDVHVRYIKGMADTKSSRSVMQSKTSDSMIRTVLALGYVLCSSAGSQTSWHLENAFAY